MIRRKSSVACRTASDSFFAMLISSRTPKPPASAQAQMGPFWKETSPFLKVSVPIRLAASVFR